MGARVLVVDDDTDILALVRTVLAEEGYEVTLAHNGREALESVRRAPPRLVLLDLAMPIMNGWEFVRAAREGILRPEVPIVIMTASPQSREHLRAMPVAGLLAKPFELDDLVRCADRYCGRQRTAVVN